MTDWLNRAISSFSLSESHLAAIGAVCVSWSMLESNVSDFLSRLLPTEDSTRYAILLGATNLRTKIDLTRALAHECVKPPAAFETLDRFLNAIDNDLRIERNRIVHDMWLAGEQPPLRVQYKPRFVRASDGSRRLEVSSSIPMSADRIRSFAAIVAWFGQMLLGSRMYYPDKCQEWCPALESALDNLREYKAGTTPADD